MNTNDNKLRFKSHHAAFTLVEMLVVGAIIVILAGLTLFATNASANAAKETRTRAVIQKIDTAMQQIFETYEDKLLAIQNDVNNTHSALPEATRQKIVTHFIRDTMRMELPQSWTEVYDLSDSSKVCAPIKTTFDTNGYSVPQSPLLEYYRAAYVSAKNALSGKEPNPAALLFLIIQNHKPEALDAFQASEVADTDGDGLLEFIDAWGNPIQFLRWAPAFSGSGLQPDMLKLLNYVPKVDMQANEDWWDNKYSGQDDEFKKAVAAAQVTYPDPLDQSVGAVSWFLYLLIYSAGADEKNDITSDEIDEDTKKPISPTVGATGILDPFAFPAGMPGDANKDGALNHFDNIHNHQWYRSY